jgi:hypothetical protein
MSLNTRFSQDEVEEEEAERLDYDELAGLVALAVPLVTDMHPGVAAMSLRVIAAAVPPPPPSRTDWTHLVPPPVLTGHASSLLPC